MSVILDPNAMRGNLVTLATAQCSWARFVKSLPPGIISTAPGALPLGVWRIDQHMVVERESGTTGSPAGKPNKYICYYIEQPYPEGGQVLDIDALEDRIVDTYVAIAQGLVTGDGSDDNIPGVVTTAVALEYDSRKGPYIEYSGSYYVGARICVYFDERYA